MKGKELIKRYEDLRLRKEELKTNLKKHSMKMMSLLIHRCMKK